VARELERHKSDLEGVQEVSWDKWGTARVGDYIFSPWKRKRKSSTARKIFLYTTELYQQLRD
jgi:hypothetical protein